MCAFSVAKSCLTLGDPMDYSQPGSSAGFSKQEYWNGLPFLPPRNLPDPGIKPTSPGSPALAGRFFTTESPRKPISNHLVSHYEPCWKLSLRMIT